MRPILISLGALALFLGAHQISLPGIQPVTHDGEGLRMYNILALGLAPFVSGFLLVEWGALLIPPWRSLRVGAPEDRAKLKRVAVIVGCVLTVGQAFVLVTGLAGMGVVYPLGPGPRLVVVLTLIGATVAQLALARAVDSYGVGNGFSILFLGEMLQRAVKPLWHALRANQSGEIPPWELPAGILAVAVLAGVALWLFRSRPGPAESGTPHPSWISRPACGIAPLTVVLLSYDHAVRLATVIRNGLTGEPVPFTMAGPFGLRLGLALSAALLFAWLFNRPVRIAEAWKRLVPNSTGTVPPLSIVFKECIAFIAVLTAVEFWTTRQLGAIAPDVPAVLLATAIFCDLIRESRARAQESGLVPVWEVHQTYVVPPLLCCLENEGISAFAQGQCFRALMQFFAPYVPIRILVPAHQAVPAEAILRDRLLKASVRPI